MTIYENNTKKFRKDNKLRCKCGSCRYDIVVFEDGNGDRRWIKVNCRKCGETLFYNGA